MNCLTIFFYNKTIYVNDKADDPFVQNTHSLLMQSVAFGDWCLTPVRYLGNGNEFVVNDQEGANRFSHHPAFTSQERNWLRLALAIIFVIPGVLAGTFFKGIGHIEQAARSLHYLATMHNRVIDHLEVGDPSNPLDKPSVLSSLQQDAKNNYFRQPYLKVTVYAQSFFIDKNEWLDLDVQEINFILS